jgi:hypothetical protein
LKKFKLVFSLAGLNEKQISFHKMEYKNTKVTLEINTLTENIQNKNALQIQHSNINKYLQQKRNENETNRQIVRPTTSTQSLIDKFISLDSKPKNTENIVLKTAELTHEINDFLPQHNDSENINNFNSNIEDNIDKVIESLTNEENIDIFLERQRLKFMENKVINQNKNNMLYVELRIAAHNIDVIASIQSFPKLNNLLEFIKKHKIDIMAISETNIDYHQGHFINQEIKSKVYSIIFSERDQKGKGSGTALVILYMKLKLKAQSRNISVWRPKVEIKVELKSKLCHIT